MRIFLPKDELDSPVVVCTGSRFNEGQSITNAAERIAAEVTHGHRLPTPLVWIEHYEKGIGQRSEDPASFDLVISRATRWRTWDRTWERSAGA
jgi:hypothetical protein